MNARSAGLAIGLFVGLIICVVFFKYWNKGGKLKTQYDEKQEIVRGRAYKYAFWTLVVYEAVMCILSGFSFNLHADMFIMHFSGIIIAALVHASYSVWNDAYMGLNTNSKRFTVCMILIGLVNLLSGIAAIASGSLVIDGVLQAPFTNLLCAFIFIVIGVEIGVKDLIDKKGGEE